MSFGASPFLASFIFDYGTTPMMMGLLRVVCMLPVFGLIVLFKKEDNFRITFRQFLAVAALALTGGVLTTVLLYEAYTCIDASTATTLNFTYPIFVLAMGVIFYKDRVSKSVLISFVLCIAGILLFCNPTGHFTWRGFFFGLGSGVSYAIYVLYIDKSRILEEMHFYPFTFYFFLLSTIIFVPVVMATEKLSFAIPATEWLYIILFAVVCGIGATVFFQIGVREIGSKKASILAAMEPVTSLVLGALFMGEPITFLNTAGIVLVLASTIVLVLFGQAGETGE